MTDFNLSFEESTGADDTMSWRNSLLTWDDYTIAWIKWNGGKAKANIGKNVSETISMEDTQMKTIAKVLTETVAISEKLSKSFARLFTETLETTEIFIKRIVKNVSEAVNLSEFSGKVFGITKSEHIITTERLKRYKNGTEIIWEKLGKVATSWSKKIGVSTIWTNTENVAFAGYKTWSEVLITWSEWTVSWDGLKRTTKVSTNYSKVSSPETEYVKIKKAGKQ